MNDPKRKGGMAGDPKNPAGLAPTKVRLDKWLWAARLFKTRALASEAIGGGRVHLNGERGKPARQVAAGDQVQVRLGPFEYLLTVRGVSERRGSAAMAATLYVEDPAGRERRQRLADQHRLAATAFAHGEGKPSKKERREIRKLRGKT